MNCHEHTNITYQQDVAAILANLVGSSVQIDSRELDEASNAIISEASKLSAHSASNPGKFEVFKYTLS